MFSSTKSLKVLVPVVTRALALPLYLSNVPAGFPSPAEDFADGVLDLNDLIEHPAATLRWWLVPESQDHDEFQAVEMDEDSEVWGVVKNVIRCLP